MAFIAGLAIGLIVGFLVGCASARQAVEKGLLNIPKKGIHSSRS